MELRDLLLDSARPMIDPDLDQLRKEITSGNYELPLITRDDFKEKITDWIQSNPQHVLSGFEKFSVRHTCFGVTHYIDSLLIENSNNVQILEHDYTYYRRLFPDKEWASVGNLHPCIPLIMALPFPGAGDIHPAMSDILDECLNKNIDVHLDCAWLPIIRKIQFDFSHPAIQSFAISLSKGLSLGWNRIGISYRRNDNSSNAISIADSFDMINQADLSIGMEFLKRFDNGYLWKKYGSTYDQACKLLRVRPTNVLHMVFELGSNRPKGIRDVLLRLQQKQH